MNRLRGLAIPVVAALLSGAPGVSVAHGPPAVPRPAPPRPALLYPPTPATLYIPQETIPLIRGPSCGPASIEHSALGCVYRLDNVDEYVPPADIAEIVDGVAAGLAPFAVRVTSRRPPSYVPYMMLLPGGPGTSLDVAEVCTHPDHDCGGDRRHDVATTTTGDGYCPVADAVHVALLAFGYLSGLENADDPTDVMFYPPELATSPLGFIDACSNLVEIDHLSGGACERAYHSRYCDDVDGTINTYRELLDVYGPGPVLVDETPPIVVSTGLPTEPTELAPGAPLPLTATLSDDSGYIFVRWTLASDDVDLGSSDVNEDGIVCLGHNDLCDYPVIGDFPYAQPDGHVYEAAMLATVAVGTYHVTFEAADLAGNAIVPLTATITTTPAAPEPDPGTTGGSDSSSPDSTSVATSFDDTADAPSTGPGTDGAVDTSAATGPEASASVPLRGCGCSGAATKRPWWIAILLLRVRRVRRAAPCASPDQPKSSGM